MVSPNRLGVTIIPTHREIWPSTRRDVLLSLARAASRVDFAARARLSKTSRRVDGQISRCVGMMYGHCQRSVCTKRSLMVSPNRLGVTIIPTHREIWPSTRRDVLLLKGQSVVEAPHSPCPHRFEHPPRVPQGWGSVSISAVVTEGGHEGGDWSDRSLLT
jgi:hypothetical protein